MPLSLSCSCGARFEVEETLAGQTVSCPECQQPLTATAGSPRPVRTSGFALASTVLALVLAFTGVGTALAVLLGIIALIVIAQSRGRVKGVGYAVFGIVWGLVFTGLFFFALARGEIAGISEGLHEQLMSSQVDRTGPLEVKRLDKGFAITRPSAKWGVARPKLVEEIGGNCELMLLHPGKETWVAVQGETYNGFLTLDALRHAYVGERFKNSFDFLEPRTRRGTRPFFSNATEIANDVLESKDGVQRAEIKVEVKMDDMWLTYLVHIVLPEKGGKVYYVEGWAARKRFPQMEDEVRRALNSFRLLNE